MPVTENTSNWVALSAIGSVIMLFTLWLPWVFVPLEVVIEDAASPELEFPELRSLLTPFSTMKTGISGVIDLGIFIPSWVFILLIMISGVMAILNALKVLNISYWIVFGLMGISIVVLTYWGFNSIDEGSKIQSGFLVAAIGCGLLLIGAVKARRSLICAEQGVPAKSDRSGG